MNNEYFGAATTPTEDFLAHYGVRGMKWGDRKAIAEGGSRGARKLGRQYAKAQKKLAKLEKQAANTNKYKKRAIRMGIGAAAAGGLAAVGTSGVSSAMRAGGRAASGAMKGIGNAAEAVGRGLIDSRKHGQIGSALVTGGRNIRNAGKSVSSGLHGASHAVDEWGRSTSATDSVRNALEKQFRGYGAASGAASRASTGAASKASSAIKGVSNNTLARIGAGAIGAGLAAGAARNAYKAKTAQKKAQQFRAEMNKAFAGTKYANGGSRPVSQKKRKNRG